jgi:hypothetical protein
MMNKSKMLRFLSLSIAVAGSLLISGHFTESRAQRDPFDKPEWAKPKKVSPQGKTGSTEKKTPPPVVPVMAPAIEQRIAYYKQLREAAAANGLALPKVTSVLTLEEMAVTGIFRTPRGYAAMVEAKPIKLSYTIYPGEKFFDGQLVAIEENRLVFRRIVKMSNGKFIASVENKALRQYSVQEEVQGTAPVENSAPSTTKTEVVNNTAPVNTENKSEQTVVPKVIVSPLDEMNKQPQEEPQDSKKAKPSKKNTKPVKVAKKS